VVRLALTSGHYIDVKRELNAGEHRKVWAGMVKDGVTPGEVTKLDPERVGLTRLLEYLVGWSFCDAQGHPVPLSEAALLNLQNHVFREVAELVDKHEEAQAQRVAEEQKKILDGATGLRAIS